MAFMRSTNTKWWYLTGEFTQRTIKTAAEAEQVAQVLGFASAQSAPKAIQAELDRVALNRAQLVKEIADAVLAGVAAGVSVTAEVDSGAIAAAVEAQLADEFAELDGAIVELAEDVNRPRTVS